VDASGDLGVAVGVTATINSQTGATTWRFTTQDPLNGGRPLDALLGFLPPDNAQGVGSAYVLFSARPKPGKPGECLHSGDQQALPTGGAETVAAEVTAPSA
jgi:hypothetical protein